MVRSKKSKNENFFVRFWNGQLSLPMSYWVVGILMGFAFGFIVGIIVFGLFLMVSTVDLIMVYLSIEIVSIMSFILAGYLKQNTRSNEAGLKYVVYGAFSSGIMLFGLSYIYGLTGSTNYFLIQQAIVNMDASANTALFMAMVMVLAGFGYKISSVPFLQTISTHPPPKKNRK